MPDHQDAWNRRERMSHFHGRMCSVSHSGLGSAGGWACLSFPAPRSQHSQRRLIPCLQNCHPVFLPPKAPGVFIAENSSKPSRPSHQHSPLSPPLAFPFLPRFHASSIPTHKSNSKPHELFPPRPPRTRHCTFPCSRSRLSAFRFLFRLPLLPRFAGGGFWGVGE